MKKNILLLIGMITISFLSAQNQEKIKLMARWDDESMPDANYGGTPFSYAGCYGYAAAGREYAIIGSSANIHFIDITDPANPLEVDRFPGGDVTVWREMTTYGHYCYAVSDATDEGLMIFDLSGLPDNVTKVGQTSQFFTSSHTLFCDEPNGRLYFMGSSGGNVVILDVATNPEAPVLLAANQLEGGYIHDMFVKDNIGYANHGWEGLYIYDFTNAAIPDLLASIPTNGYCHSSFITEDGQYLAVADEVPTGLPLLMVDVENAATGDIEIAESFRFPLLTDPGETVTYHNPHIKGNYLYVSSYMDGLQVFDITDPLNPSHFAWYDTFENTEYDGYNGCWGAYPFLPSGNLLASDIQNGLFVLQYDTTSVGVNTILEDEGMSLYPNPADNFLKISLANDNSTIERIEVLNMAGQISSITSSLLNDQFLNIENLTSGMYLLKVYTREKGYWGKFLKK